MADYAKKHLYTTREDEWLRENILLYDYKTLTVMFNETFGANVGNGAYPTGA